MSETKALQNYTEISDMLISSHSIVPNGVADLAESEATTTSVTATWTKPDGVVDSYLVSCSAGTTPDYIEPENGGSPYSATCSGLLTAGDNYTITVTSHSGDKSGSPASVQVTACKDSHVYWFYAATTTIILNCFYEASAFLIYNL